MSAGWNAVGASRFEGPKIMISFPNASDDFMKANPQFGNGCVKKIEASSSRTMNTHEAKFAMKLEADRREGVIEDWKFEPIRLRLAERTTYTPDFLVVYDNGGMVSIKFIEVKGFKRDDAMVKFKVARELYPWAEFQMWSLTKKSWKRVL